ncbi:hypothetical protein KCG44_09945 [Pacificimonas sp. WHA3]|uniref:Uncharacterized protein n=1 Tax=Pacificimonas pallii TaxID=2827236 RepID=A0ABS6SGX4_9SPHN|nr:hypothetical protein [Pacificimonas pallii]MBV7257102.1 hypothetical protein [Pacificimonas pallii]
MIEAFRTSIKCAILAMSTFSFGALAVSTPEPGRVDLIDMTLESDTILSATITKTRSIPREKSPGLAPGFHRMLVHADVTTLITARGGVPAQIKYLVDVPAADNGRAPRMKNMRALLFLGQEQSPGEFALAHRYGQQPWSAAREQNVRTFASELAEPAQRALRPREIISAFHVEGSIPGESESQIFMQTASGDPMSLIVLNRPGERPRYTVATGDIIDTSMEPPSDGSIVALMLACDLPTALPGDILAEQVPSVAAALTRDYGFVRSKLGACERNFQRRGDPV